MRDGLSFLAMTATFLTLSALHVATGVALAAVAGQPWWVGVAGWAVATGLVGALAGRSRRPQDWGSVATLTGVPGLLWLYVWLGDHMERTAIR